MVLTEQDLIDAKCVNVLEVISVIKNDYGLSARKIYSQIKYHRYLMKKHRIE